tara:strand:+ start:1849 stop:2058 length:210 start_codon:yes stop_codon:yes gene_type:complete
MDSKLSHIRYGFGSSINGYVFGNFGNLLDTRLEGEMTELILLLVLILLCTAFVVSLDEVKREKKKRFRK